MLSDRLGLRAALSKDRLIVTQILCALSIPGCRQSVLYRRAGGQLCACRSSASNADRRNHSRMANTGEPSIINR